MEHILVKFLQALEIPVSSQYVRKLVQSHPDFPSLLSASDTLYRLGIDHAVHRAESEDIADLSFPYILLIGNTPVLITKAADLSKYHAALEHGEGIVLQAQRQIRSRDKTNNLLATHEKRLRYYLTGIAAILAGLMAFLFLNAFSGLTTILLLFALTGAITGCFLIAKDLGLAHEAVEAFCNDGKKSNCDSVLKTDLKLMGIGLSDATVIYFSFQLSMLALAQSLPVVRHAYLQMLAWLSTLTIPVVIFSIYYQYAQVKTWCRLCMVVILVLVGQAIVFGIAEYTGHVNLLNTIPPGSLLSPIALFSIFTLIVLAMKTSRAHARELADVGRHGNRVKHAAPVFVHLLSQQNGIDNTVFEYEMVLGNVFAPVRITMVTNLYCIPCRAKHSVITDLLEQYPGQVSVVLRFVPGGNDDEARMETVPYLLNHWLTQIHGSPDEIEQTEAMVSDWFRLGDLKKFKAQYSVNNTKQDDAKQLMGQHYEWAKKMGIASTPALFVNGRSIPKDYTIQEVVMMAPGLTDWLKNTNEKVMQIA